MKLKYLILAYLLPILLISSCKRDEDPIFEKTASVRMTEAVEQAYSVLQAQEAGWLIKYYPSESREFGGYTIFAKFISDAQVSLTSDVNDDLVTSSYAVIPETGAVLSLNGYNKIINFFTEPGIDNGGIGADDTGMKGDFEFIVLHATADSVVLKGKKSGNKMLMLPLQAGEFTSLAASYQEEGARFSEYNLFAVENSAGESSPLTYNMRTFQDSEDGNSDLMTFRVMPGGIEFYETVDFQGVSFDKLDFVAPSEQYPLGYYTNDTKSFKIVPQPTPLNVWFRQNLWSMSKSNVGPTGQVYWQNAQNGLTESSVVLNNFYIGTFSGIQGTVYVLQNGAVVGLITHNLTLVAGSEDLVTISLDGSIYNLGGGFGLAYWTAGLNSLTTPFQNRTFRITAASPDEPDELLLTDIGISTNTFRIFLKDIDDPFEN